jgi:branched-chain amino acid transport system permease protein
MDYLYTTGALIGMYCILTLSTNVIQGYGGLYTLSQGALFGIGAYSVAVATMAGVNFWFALLIAIVITSVFSILMALPSLRAGGLYFFVVSFSMQIILSDVFTNLDITGGSMGIPGIPAPTVFGFSLASPLQQMIFIWLFVLVLFYMAHRIYKSPFGELVEAMRQQEMAVEAQGKSVLKVKVANAALGGFYAGVAGALYAPLMGFIDPHNFSVHVAFYAVVLVIVGGEGTLFGSILGPVVLVLLPQLISFLPLGASMTGPLQQLIYGLMLIAFMLFRPGGLVQKKVRVINLNLDQFK